MFEYYRTEKAQGTELPVIVGVPQKSVENERERLRSEQERTWRQQTEQQRHPEGSFQTLCSQKYPEFCRIAQSSGGRRRTISRYFLNS
jgi:hypothetical protein